MSTYQDLTSAFTNEYRLLDDYIKDISKKALDLKMQIINGLNVNTSYVKATGPTYVPERDKFYFDFEISIVINNQPVSKISFHLFITKIDQGYELSFDDSQKTLIHPKDQNIFIDELSSFLKGKIGMHFKRNKGSKHNSIK